MRLKTKVVTTIAGLLLGVSIASSVINYHKNVRDTQAQLQNTSLPLSVDNIYTEIQQRMIEPLLVSSLMSNDTFLRDWVMNGEGDIDGIARYLAEIQRKYNVFTTFLVSDKTKKYYHSRGVIDVINKENSADVWYFRFKDRSEPCEINLDYNVNLSDSLIMFINYKVMNYKKEMIGVTGVGVKILNIEEMLGSFKSKYRYDVYFVAQNGEITLFSKGLNKRGNIANIDGLKSIKNDIFKAAQGSFEYKDEDSEYLLRTKYIEKLKLYLFVEINKEEYMGELKKTFYINLLISLLVTAIVAFIIVYTINIYQKQLVEMASEDSLTKLANRRRFDELFEKFYKLYKKGINKLTLVLIDIDDFKKVNDDLGHLVGDQVLIRIAEILKAELRNSDIITRWGGEEFAILFIDVNLDNTTQIAQKICDVIREDKILNELLGRQLTVSAGLGELNTLESQDGLVHKVDIALYEAKRTGKNQVIVA
jgi:diguanylate cyclase (GGDEF)-like protein